MFDKFVLNKWIQDLTNSSRNVSDFLNYFIAISQAKYVKKMKSLKGKKERERERILDKVLVHRS